MSIVRNIFVFYLFILFVLLVTPSALHADGESFWLNSSAFNPSQPDNAVSFGFYPSGYSDGWWWDESPRRHLNYVHGSEPKGHETLSGEWAAAVYYTGIHNNKVNWLTNHFEWPTWTPDTSFVPDSCPNDTPRLTAESIIHDPYVQVTIDYSLVDIGDSNYASLPFYPQGSSTVAYVKSEKYILIQTYNIKNTRATNVTGVKFYQMLVGLVTLSTSNSSTYSDANVPGLLAGSFDPCNPNSPASF